MVAQPDGKGSSLELRARASADSDAAVGGVRIEAPARLHLGFVDLHGGLGRRFGSLGLALEDLGACVRVSRADATSIEGPGAERVCEVVALLRDRAGFRGEVRIEVERTIAPHVGLGSGTQIALATGVAISDLHSLNLTPRALAQMLDRGARSGIGIGTFESGGFVLDGGRGDDGSPPPLISRLPFPADWRVLLVFDRSREGLHGEQELAAFRRLAPFPEERAARLARLVLMRLLPALAEGRVAEFGSAVTELQAAVGDHFAPVQGGRFTSARVARALEWLQAAGAAGVGQSSWGPTGFAIVGSAAQAEALARDLDGGHAAGSDLVVRVVRGRNRGAQRWVTPPQTPPHASRFAAIG
ncbi:MAG TPA: beta-ribofuranosylaminobenzene 5'-phosphate synthase family protein [Burkholderiaceae bacterium]